MNTKQDHFESILSFLVFAAILIQLSMALSEAWPFTTDDAFISWRYAEHLAHGEGLRWNAHQLPVEGYSNFAWVLLVALFIKLGLPLVVTIKCFSCLSLLAALIFLYQFSRLFLPPLLATLPVYLFSHYNGVVWWTVSGLETSFFVALGLLVCWQSARALGLTEPSPMKGVHSASAWIIACFGLLLVALTRFDGIVWCLVVVCFIICDIRHSERRAGSPKMFAMTGTFLLIFALPYTLYLSWRLSYFGHLFPNSYLCKAVIQGHSARLVMDYLYLAFPCLILSLPYLLARKDCRHLLLWLPSLIYALLLLRANPDIAYYNRLFLSAFAVFTVLPVLGVQTFLSYFNNKASNHNIIITLVIIVFTHLFIPGNQADDIQTAVLHYQQRTQLRMQVVNQLNRDVPFKGRVLLADCGVIPFYARRDIEFIDSQCLNNPEMTKRSWASYAHDLNNVIKPDWVIDTYYPEWQQGNSFNETLRNIGFFNHYELMASYQSHRFVSKQGKPSEEEADFVYRVYKRTS